MRLGFDKDDTQQPMKVFWNEDLDQSLFTRSRIVDTALSPPAISHYPGWRLASYLNLQAEPMTTLSIRCNPVGIEAVMTGGRSCVSLTFRRGVMISFPMSRDERIEAIHLCTCDNFERPISGPYLLVSENCPECGNMRLNQSIRSGRATSDTASSAPTYTRCIRSVTGYLSAALRKVLCAV